jgi:hypothetical protein
VLKRQLQPLHCSLYELKIEDLNVLKMVSLKSVHPFDIIYISMTNLLSYYPKDWTNYDTSLALEQADSAIVHS